MHPCPIMPSSPLCVTNTSSRGEVLVQLRELGFPCKFRNSSFNGHYYSCIYLSNVSSNQSRSCSYFYTKLLCASASFLTIFTMISTYFRKRVTYIIKMNWYEQTSLTSLYFSLSIIKRDNRSVTANTDNRWNVSGKQ